MVRSSIISLSIALLVCNSAKAKPSIDQMIRQFQDTVFSQEFIKSDHRLSRWTVGPKFGLAGNRGVVNRYLTVMDQRIDDIIRISGLSWQVAAKPLDATLQANFVTRDQFPQATGITDPEQFKTSFGNSVCLGRFLYGATANVIEKAVVVFDIESRDELMRHCIAEEMVQVMGIPNDACHYRPSLFCEDDIVDEMQPADRVLLRTLYDPRLKPGMTREEAMPIARRIIRELWRE